MNPRAFYSHVKIFRLLRYRNCICLISCAWSVSFLLAMSGLSGFLLFVNFFLHIPNLIWLLLLFFFLREGRWLNSMSLSVDIVVQSHFIVLSKVLSILCHALWDLFSFKSLWASGALSVFTNQMHYPLFSDSLSECWLCLNGVASKSWLWANQGEELVIQNKLQLKIKVSKDMCFTFFWTEANSHVHRYMWLWFSTLIM